MSCGAPLKLLSSTAKTSDKPIVHFLLSTKRQTDNTSDYLVDTVKNIAAKEMDIFLRSWWRPNTELKESTHFYYIYHVARDITPNEQ